MGKKPSGVNSDEQGVVWGALQAAAQSAPASAPSLEEQVARNPIVQEVIRLFKARIVSVRRPGDDGFEGGMSELTQLPLW
jgi:hypothetical protein